MDQRGAEYAGNSEDDGTEDGEETMEQFRESCAAVEIAHFERTGQVSSYAFNDKTWAELGYPEP
jgi:hypothetical protein